MDGNKRTAHLGYFVFLTLNDAQLDASLEEMYLQMVSIAEGRLSEAEFADWLRPRGRVQARQDVNEGKRRYRR